jgi:hypothetical protein
MRWSAAQYRTAGQAPAGLILVSTKTFAQDRTCTSALIALLDQPGQIARPDGQRRARTGAYCLAAQLRRTRA